MTLNLMGLGMLLLTTVAFAQTKMPNRRITFNGRELTAGQRERLEALERAAAIRLPDNNYWYDNRSGAFGIWGGPGLAQFPPGLGLGGAMPANCSGSSTGVFINGRELHWLDVAALSQIGPVYPGRYWLDANGDFGNEGGPRLGNMILIANQPRPKEGVFSTWDRTGIAIFPGVQ